MIRAILLHYPDRGISRSNKLPNTPIDGDYRLRQCTEKPIKHARRMFSIALVEISGFKYLLATQTRFSYNFSYLKHFPQIIQLKEIFAMT